MLSNYFTIALRNIRRSKIYSFINIFGLSIGLTCSMLIILYVKDEVSFDRFHKNGEHIYRITTESLDKDNNAGKDANTGYLQGPRFTSHIPDIVNYTRVQSWGEDFKTGTDIQTIPVLRVDASFFSVFSFPLLYGDAKTCLDDPYSIVLSEDLAEKQFGTKDVVGKLMMMKQDTAFVPCKITGVSKRCPQNSSIKFNMLMPVKASANDLGNSENWFNFFLNTFVVLRTGADIDHVEKNMQQFYQADAKEAIQSLKARFGDVISGYSYKLQPFEQIHLSKDLPAQNGLSDAGNPIYSYLLSGIAVFILLIACINFVNLTIARSVKRAKEIGIRKVIGSDRRGLIIRFLGESFLLCFIAFALAVLLVQLILPLFNTLSNKVLSFSYLADAQLIGGYIALFLLTGLLAGFYPALVLSGYNPVQILYSRFSLGGKNYLQKSLVVLQFSLASFFIIATFIIQAQFNKLAGAPLGYDDSNLVMVRNGGLKRDKMPLLKNELIKSPGVIDVAAKNGGQSGTAAKVNGDSIIRFAYETIDEAYMPLLKIPVVQGRNFSTRYPYDSTQSVIVNESFVKKAGWQHPVGETVDFWFKNEKYKVIGVVKDYHFQPMTTEIGPQLFTMKYDNDYGMVFIKVKPNTAANSLKHIEAVFKKLFPFAPYSYAFKDEQNRKAYEAEAKWKQIMMFSAVITIFISCIGLFGLSVLSAEKRTKEIGIRKVLGASVNGLVAVLSKDFLKLVCIALVVAVPAAWIASNKWLENYPYRITLSWWLFAGAALLVVMIALLTVSFQAIKAAVGNPVKALRTE
ncbi:MAG: ABC transporter permease [Chitinophagaceae bacterium]|nr:ABC transporter permease [Chitinophagaceae bacterium]